MKYPIEVFESDNAADLVPAGANNNSGGWVSGSIKSLGIGGSATVQFDLGENWVYYPEVNIAFHISGTATGVAFVVSCAPSLNGTYIRTIGGFGANGVSTSYIGPLNASASTQSIRIRPHGRYLRVNCSGVATAPLNADAVVRLSMYPV